MKIMLCGEGVHEVGRPRVWNSREQCYVSVEGWMQTLTRRFCPSFEGLELVARLKTSLTLLPRDEKKYMPLPPGHGKRALAAKLAAEREACKAVIYMLDADTCENTKWRQKRDEVLQGFDRVQNGVVGIACIPMSASEAWFLADAKVWAEISRDALAHLPRRPEQIWGPRDEPSGNHPHRIFARVCAHAGVEDCLETRTRIAAEMDISEVALSCPNSFKVFYDDVREGIR